MGGDPSLMARLWPTAALVAAIALVACADSEPPLERSDLPASLAPAFSRLEQAGSNPRVQVVAPYDDASIVVDEDSSDAVVVIALPKDRSFAGARDPVGFAKYGENGATSSVSVGCAGFLVEGPRGPAVNQVMSVSRLAGGGEGSPGSRRKGAGVDKGRP